MPDLNSVPSGTARVALATTDGHTCANTHFGEAPVFAIYAFDGGKFRHIQDVGNPSTGEEAHGNGRKTASILEHLAEHEVQILVARRFGPSITRIQRSRVAVITGGRDALDTLPELAQAWPKIQAALTLAPETRRPVLAGLDGELPQGKISAQVDAGFCRGCGRCVPGCPVGAIMMRQRLAVIDASACVGCRSCIEFCPFGAITEFES